MNSTKEVQILSINEALKELEEAISMSQNIMPDLVASLNQVLQMDYEEIMKESEAMADIPVAYSLEEACPVAKIIQALAVAVQVINKKITLTRDNIGL